MSKGNKFGTFGGVFTPSVLTILGVIMYLRLGVVVGNASQLVVLGIIFISHIISITTGLSVSSISTDRKVKAGGIYYILSRSLGLPIGGSIGIALFVGTALSITIYILGFAESVNDALGFESLRITGTITLIAITSIALISTSLAIKTQYYIMAGIALSLISIVAGITLFPLDELANTDPISWKSLITDPQGEGILPVGVIFGIFFPAVTGFTAGVAMSGDLKDPKRAIPKGTLAAIAVGFVVYICLSFLLWIYIDAKALREDTNILKKLTLLVQTGWSEQPVLLFAGIWGATLSSALGGILGAPRILQAMSVDKITPKLFGKGVGKGNEPRNALLLTFCIAELGVMIGDLNAIAPVVSMFYLTAYGFINLTSALESWTASDFRPTFKIPKWISILGAIFTFGVMAQIGLAAMIIALVIIFLIFLFLSKKQINLGFSNVWQGVWAEVVREGLFRIDKKTRKDDKKNWRPNILLFSGDKSRRAYLVDFGKSLVGKLGLVSSFELIKTDDVDSPLRRAQQSVETGTGFSGMFFRKYQTRNVYEGIQTIAETYGFSGVEPNTVLLGWARYSKSPHEFTMLLDRFRKMDYNIVIMDYDKRYGFGQFQTIDIWWKGSSRDISFALTMARFLTADDAWLNAKVRLFIMIDKSLINATEVYQTMEDELEELRIYAEVKIVDNDGGNKSLYDAIEVESSKADLIFIELPEITEGEEEAFYKETNDLCEEIGTVVLYRGSSHFMPIDIGLSKLATKKAKQQIIAESKDELEENSIIILPQDEAVADHLSRLRTDMDELIIENGKRFFQPITDEHALMLTNLKDIVEATLSRAKALAEQEEATNSEEFPKLAHNAFLEAEKVLKAFGGRNTKAQANGLYQGMISVNQQLRQLGLSFPKALTSSFGTKSEITEEKLKRFTSWQRFRVNSLKKSGKFTYKLRKYLVEWFRQHGLEMGKDLARKFNIDSADFHDEVEKLLRRFGSVLQDLEKQCQSGQLDIEALQEDAHKCYEIVNELIKADQSRFDSYVWFMRKQMQLVLQDVAYSVDNLDMTLPNKKKFGWADKLKMTREEILATPQIWAQNQMLFSNMHRLDLSLQEFQAKLAIVVDQLKEAFYESLQGNIIYDLKKLSISFQNFVDDQSNELPSISRSELEDNFQYQHVINDFMGNLEWLVGDLPTEIEVLSEEALQNPKTEEVIALDSFEISPVNIINYIVQAHFMEPLVADTDLLNEKVIIANDVIEDIERILAVSGKSFNPEQGKDADQDAFVQLIKDELARIEHIYQELLNMEEKIGKRMGKYLGDANEKLTTYGLVKEAINLDSFLRTQTRKQVFTKFTEFKDGWLEKSQEALTDLRYKYSGSLSKWLRLQPATSYDVPNLVSFTEQVVPSKAINESLPFYYKQLFVKEQRASMELWHNRSEELLTAQFAIKRHRDGISGAILVTGQPDAGKSFLSEKIARTYFKNQNVFSVHPPEGGETSLRTFRSAINKALKKPNYRIETAFDKLENHSIVIFHDVELWWEEGPNGFQIIDKLSELIDEYSDKCCMILNINQLTYQVFQKEGKLDKSFMEVITCKPMNARDLKEIILLRHKSSHLKFRLDGVIENKLSEWKLAGLFTKYAKLSKGNVGFALQSWLSNIIDVNKSEIDIMVPNKVNQDAIDELSEEWIEIIRLFILHKKMLPSKFARLTKMELYDAQHEIKALLRAGVLSEQNGVLEINSYFMPFLLERFENKDWSLYKATKPE